MDHTLEQIKTRLDKIAVGRNNNLAEDSLTWIKRGESLRDTLEFILKFCPVDPPDTKVMLMEAIREYDGRD